MLWKSHRLVGHLECARLPIVLDETVLHKTDVSSGVE